MNRMIKKTFTCALCLLLATLTLAGCSKGNKFDRSDNGGYVDKKTGIVYIDAPGCYEPIAMSDELYGVIGEAELYRIEGADPEKWLCEKIAGAVFYAEDVELPALDELDVSHAEIMLEDVALTKLSDKAIDDVIKAYTEGERISRPMVREEQIEINWRIRFADEDLGLYYQLAFMELTDGTKIIFNRFEGVCVEAGDILDSYISEYKDINEA